jgi:hypothetical protein
MTRHSGGLGPRGRRPCAPDPQQARLFNPYNSPSPLASPAPQSEPPPEPDWPTVTIGGIVWRVRPDVRTPGDEALEVVSLLHKVLRTLTVARLSRGYECSCGTGSASKRRPDGACIHVRALQRAGLIGRMPEHGGAAAWPDWTDVDSAATGPPTADGLTWNVEDDRWGA